MSDCKLSGCRVNVAASCIGSALISDKECINGKARTSCGAGLGTRNLGMGIARVACGASLTRDCNNGLRNDCLGVHGIEVHCGRDTCFMVWNSPLCRVILIVASHSRPSALNSSLVNSAAGKTDAEAVLPIGGPLKVAPAGELNCGCMDGCSLRGDTASCLGRVNEPERGDVRGDMPWTLLKVDPAKELTGHARDRKGELRVALLGFGVAGTCDMSGVLTPLLFGLGDRRAASMEAETAIFMASTLGSGSLSLSSLDLALGTVLLCALLSMRLEIALES